MIALRALAIGCAEAIADLAQATRERMWRPAPDSKRGGIAATMVRWLAVAFTLYLVGAVLIAILGAIIAAGFWLLIGAALAAALIIYARRH